MKNDLQDLLIYKQISVVIKDLHPRIAKFEKQYKYTLGNKIMDQAINSASLIFEIALIDGIEQARLAVQSAGPSSPTPPTPGRFQFTRELQLNDVGTEVIALQQFLNHRGYTVNPNQGEEGSKGNETSFFGELTRQALIRYQQDNNISPALGYFGPITRGISNPMIR